MNYYELTVPHFIRMLGQVHRWLDKAAEHAQQKKYDVKVLLVARLAPDQFAFTRQVQTLADIAKNAAARLAGVEPPKFEDTETTVEQLRERLDKTVAWLKQLKPEQFEGAAERRITLPFAPNKYMTGADCLSQFVLPNFYFHSTTAYAILRHNGIDVGKGDFLGDITMHEG
jgi:uncharacterized protein